jgi:predicted ATPase
VGPIGRDAELSLVADRLRDRRLVTLVGPGGIGKTTLARAAVARCATEFGEGARAVDLTRVDSAAAVKESLAAQLGYTSFRSLLDAPGDHSVLVLVDNCEHVVDAVADAIDALLDACQMPTVLATSRTALEVPGETLVPVGPLTLPPAGTADGPAVALFVERARDAGAEVEPGEVVAALCRRLDGVPLAIELAAARTRAMAPAEILDRLVAGLDVLDRPRRRGARRHQSLRAAIGWSYELLDEDERALFDRLAVFSGPFTADLAHAVVGDEGTTAADTQDMLDRLVGTSMVVADTTEAVTWYRELETLRAFAGERLDERGERRAVEARFVDHVVERAAGIITRGAATWSDDAFAELLGLYGNITAALRWCLAVEADPARAHLLTAVLWGVVHQAHTEEIGALAEQVLARWPDSRDPFRADATATAATCRSMLGDYAGAIALATAELPGAEASPYAPATLRRALGHAHRAAGEADTAAHWFADLATRSRALGLTALAVEADCARAHILADLGRAAEGLTLAEAAETEASAAGSVVAAVWAHAVQGSILLRTDPAEAAARATDALAAGRRLGYAAGISTNLRTLAMAALCHGDPAEAASRVLDLLDDLLGRGSTYELRMVFDTGSAVLAAAGDEEAAADLAATALALPVVSITASVRHELFPLDATGGTVVPARDAILLARRALAAVAGSSPPAAPVPASTSAPEAAGTAGADTRRGVLRPDGETWRVGFGDEVVTVRASKGLADIARLVAAAGREVHCLELIGSAVDEAGTGEVLDAAARRAYEDRIRELQADLDEAEAAHDTGRAERAQAEMDVLVDQLTEALGLGGRSRTGAGAAERARSTVTQRIRSTLKRLDAVHPRLARHLDASLHTGTYCSYAPEDPVDWEL